ncbi:MAG: hypothetical protein HOY71_00635, partial [Nonomuraea sp.]|nr:hypothetical protein [Nonomuraea sp.]
LGGVRAGLWPDLPAELAGLGDVPVFEPALPDAEREEARAAWRDLLNRHVPYVQEENPS